MNVGAFYLDFTAIIASGAWTKAESFFLSSLVEAITIQYLWIHLPNHNRAEANMTFFCIHLGTDLEASIVVWFPYVSIDVL
jgi:hypothetical protein